MKNSLFVAGLWAVMACSGCHLQNQQASPAVAAIGKIEIYDTSAANIIDSNAAIEVIGKNYKWCEGPVWGQPPNAVVFRCAGKQNLLMEYERYPGIVSYAIGVYRYRNPKWRERLQWS